MNKPKSLEKMADNLQGMLNSFSELQYTLTPKVCPSCHKLISDREELKFMFHIGECARCDKSYGDALEERLADIDYDSNRPEEAGSTYLDFK